MGKKKIHFIGINGAGISGVACIAKNRGFDVTGCDMNERGDYTDQLIKNNIPLSLGHSPEHLKDIDIVVVSPALLFNDRYKQIEETKLAMETKEMIKWQKFLGDYIMKNKDIIAVCGTHGKTTTTTLISLILEKANLDPTAFVGGVVKEWNCTYRVGSSDYYVCEGDEFDGNFLNYNPKYVILNNLEMEHPEFFKDFDDYKNNFVNFFNTMQNDGKVVFYYDDKNVRDLIISIKDKLLNKNIKLIGYTFHDKLDKVSEGINIVSARKEKNKIVVNNDTIEHLLLGDHNNINLTSAVVMAEELGVKLSTIKEVAKDFLGTKRRMDLLLCNERIKLYDDYAHHHTQIKCTINSIKENLSKDEELIVVLEPHLISRIRDNTQAYRDALLLADYPIITKIFKSRESYMDDIDVAKMIDDSNISYIEDYDQVVSYIKDIASKNKKLSILIMGAGNSYKIAKRLKEEL